MKYLQLIQSRSFDVVARFSLEFDVCHVFVDLIISMAANIFQLLADLNCCLLIFKDSAINSLDRFQV